MIQFLLYLVFFTNAQAANSILESEVIGCPKTSQTQYVKMESSVDVQQSYLDKFASDPKKQEEIKKKAIETQLKYLVGSFKEFHTNEIEKSTFGHYQSELKITKIEQTSGDYPEYDFFWPKDRGEGGNDYIAYLKQEGPGKKAVARIHYSVLLHTFSCNTKSLSSESYLKELNSIPFPRDPFIGFWVNTKEERENDKWKTPDCFSRDFSVFGVPEQAWFFWSPVQYGKNGQCKMKNQSMVLKNIFTKASAPKNEIKNKMKNDNKIPQTLSGSFYFGTVSEDAELFSKRSIDEFSQKVIETFDFCKDHKRPMCLGKWTELPKIGDKYVEPGAGNYIYFMKYLTTLMDVKSYSLKEKGKDYFILNLELENPKTKRVAKTKIFYGNTSVYEPVLGSPEYWKSIYKSMHEDDFILYIGHAGLGVNLQLSTMLKYGGIKETKEKRNKPLYMGVFNCEGLSYYGFDYENLFKEKTSENLVYLIASSGVEVNSLFSLSYLDYLLTHNEFQEKELYPAIHDYVSSRDFLGFQKINYSRD